MMTFKDAYMESCASLEATESFLLRRGKVNFRPLLFHKSAHLVQSSTNDRAVKCNVDESLCLPLRRRLAL